MKIILADHHILFREGLIGILTRDPEIEIIGVTSLARETIEKTISLKPDILLLEINLPDASGMEVLTAIHSACPDINIVILTMQLTDDLLFNYVKNGAKGYLLKDIPVDHLIESLKGIMRQETAFPRSTVRMLIDRLVEETLTAQKKNDFDLLTDRELDVLELIREGRSNLEIANALKISENTAKAHVRKILDKLNLPNRREVRNLAWRRNYPRYLNIDNPFSDLLPQNRVKKR